MLKILSLVVFMIGAWHFAHGACHTTAEKEDRLVNIITGSVFIVLSIILFIVS
jgi:hypothetical protein